MKQVKTWVLIADGGRARVLESETRTANLESLPEMQLQASDVVEGPVESDRPGRVQESVGPTRHAIEPRTPHKRQREMDFARHIARRLEETIERYDKLLIVAAPKTLGDLREYLAPAVEQKVTATVSKDLTNTPDREIPELLVDVLKS